MLSCIQLTQQISSLAKEVALPLILLPPQQANGRYAGFRHCTTQTSAESLAIARLPSHHPSDCQLVGRVLYQYVHGQLFVSHLKLFR